MVREGRVFISPVAGKPEYGVGYYVTAYEVGAQVTAASSGTTATVAAGHGFAANDKLIVGTDTTQYRTVISVTGTTLELNQIISLASGYLLVNLAQDTGTIAPNYDGAGLTIYSDMGYLSTATNNTVLTDSFGRYIYWHKWIDRWELVRNSLGAPIAIYVDQSNITSEDPVSYEVRYAHLFATSGSGTASDPWSSTGSNPLQLAFGDLPLSGVKGRGVVRMVPGCYDLGSGPTGFVADGAGSHLFGFTLEGCSQGSRVSRQGGSNSSYVNDDGAILLYGGTGVAVKVGEFSTVGNKVAEGCTLRNFKIRQTGTAGTGVGMLLRLYRSGSVSDVNITDFSTGIALASVSDFNTFTRVQTNDCQAFGIDFARTTDENGAALLTPNGQCNGNWFNGCGFSLTSRDSGYTAYGMRIDGNAVKTVIRDSWIQNFDTSGYAGILINSSITGSSSNSTSVVDCYFEGNATACWFNNPNGSPTEQYALTFSNNYVTQIETYGLWVNSGSTGVTDGVVAVGNTFSVPSSSAPYSTAKGILLGTYVQNCHISGNHFDVGGVSGSLPGGNITIVTGTISHSNLVVGSQRITGAVLVGGAVTSTGALSALASATVGTTLGVTGASTLTGGVVGGIPRNVGTWQPPTATPGSYKQPVTTEMYVGSIFVPANMTITGIQYLIGTATPGAQKVICALYNQAGTKVAASVAGGTTMTGTPSIKQQLPFTGSTYAATGPAWYFIGLMFDTATANLVAMIPAVGDVGSGVVGVAVTSLTAVTPPSSITPPTTFPGAAIVPIASIY